MNSPPSTPNSPLHSTAPTPPKEPPLCSGYWHEDFLRMLPMIERHASYHFRHLKRDNRDEAIQEVTCSCFFAFARLVERGRTEAATWSSLAKYAVAQVRAGRRVGTSLNIKDVSSDYCQRRKRVRIGRLDRWNNRDQVWREILVEDKTATPADLASSRIDFPAWLSTLSQRDRKIALKLSEGEETWRVAELFHLSKARVSQIRRELAEAWRRFHGDLEPAVADASA